jgi:hypothetical protein
VFVTLLLLDMLPCLCLRRNLCCITSPLPKSLTSSSRFRDSLVDLRLIHSCLQLCQLSAYSSLSPALSMSVLSIHVCPASINIILDSIDLHLSQMLFSLAVVINVLFTESTFPLSDPSSLYHFVSFSSTFVLSAFRLHDSTRRFILCQFYLASISTLPLSSSSSSLLIQAPPSHSVIIIVLASLTSLRLLRRRDAAWRRGMERGTGKSYEYTKTKELCAFG